MLDMDISDVTMCIINYQWETVVYYVVFWWRGEQTEAFLLPSVQSQIVAQ